MGRYVMDAYAWIEYLDGSAAGRQVKEIIESDNEIHTCAVNVAEIISKVKRANMDVNVAVRTIAGLSQIINVDFVMAMDAGETHALMRKKIKDFGLGDCFVLECNKRIGGKIVTGDEHFRGMEDVVFIK